MTDRPLMQLHVGGFVASTLALNAEEVGAYSLLLMAAWQQGGSLPTDLKLAGGIARLPTRRWAKVWATLSEYFYISGGRLVPVAFREWMQAKARIFGRQPLPAALRSMILNRDGARCRYCGDECGPFHIDHIVSVALGGTDDPSNLCVACKPCNLSKGAKALEDWL